MNACELLNYVPRAGRTGTNQLLRGSGRWFRGRFGRATMAGVTTYVTLPIRKLGIDFARHRQHHTRGFLLGIIVAGEIALDVAERALHAERGSERAHRHDHLLSRLAGQNFQVLQRGRRTFRFVLGA